MLIIFLFFIFTSFTIVPMATPHADPQTAPVEQNNIIYGPMTLDEYLIQNPNIPLEILLGLQQHQINQNQNEEND